MKEDSASESGDTRGDNASRRFRVKVCMKEFFSDERAHAYVCVREHHCVRWLHRRLRALFALPPRFLLISQGHLLPPDEPLAILERDDTVDVIPARGDIDGKINQSTPVCKKLTSNGVVSPQESGIGDSDTTTPIRTDPDKLKSKDKVDAKAAFGQLYKEDALQEYSRPNLTDTPIRTDLESKDYVDASTAFTPLYEEDELLERRSQKLPDNIEPIRKSCDSSKSSNLESKNAVDALAKFTPCFKEDELQERKRRALAILEQFAGEPEDAQIRVARPRRRRVRRRRRVASLPDIGDDIAPAPEDCTTARNPSPESNESKSERGASVLRNGCQNSRPPRVIRPLDEIMS